MSSKTSNSKSSKTSEHKDQQNQLTHRCEIIHFDLADIEQYYIFVVKHNPRFLYYTFINVRWQRFKVCVFINYIIQSLTNYTRIGFQAEKNICNCRG